MGDTLSADQKESYKSQILGNVDISSRVLASKGRLFRDTLINNDNKFSEVSKSDLMGGINRLAEIDDNNKIGLTERSYTHPKLESLLKKIKKEFMTPEDLARGVAPVANDYKGLMFVNANAGKNLPESYALINQLGVDTVEEVDTINRSLKQDFNESVGDFGIKNIDKVLGTTDKKSSVNVTNAVTGLNLPEKFG